MAKQYKKYNFNSEFEAKGYPESSWPLLNDYLSRAANEFGLNDREVKQRLGIILSNLDSIEIANDVNSNSNACYLPNEKKITLNYDGMSARNESYLAHLCSMFHELNHVCENMTSKDSTSFMETNPRTGRIKGVSFNEVLTEMKAARLTMNLRLSADMGPGSDPRCMTRHFAYNDLMFVGTMVQTTLGISEKEFLAAADRGPDYFRETMSKKFADPSHYDLFMARVNFYADSIHAIKYAETDVPLSKEEMNNITNLTASMYRECLATMDARITSEAERGEIDPEVFLQKSKYELERLTANYEHAIRLNTKYDPKQLKDVPGLEDVQIKVLAIETINANAKKLGKNTCAELLETLNHPNADPVKLLASYGLQIPSVETFSEIDTSEYKREFLEKDYGTEQWDNKDSLGSIRAMEDDEDLTPKKAKVIQFPTKKQNTFMNDLSKKVASEDSIRNENTIEPNQNEIEEHVTTTDDLEI